MTSPYDDDPDDLAPTSEDARVVAAPDNGLHPDNDPDGDGWSNTTTLAVYDPPLPATRPTSIADRPILPGRDEIVVWANDIRGGAEYQLRRAAIHGIRSWLYALRCLRYSPIGIWRAADWWRRWAWDIETRDHLLAVLRDSTAHSTDRQNTHDKGWDHMIRRRKIRWIATAAAATTAVVSWTIAWHSHPAATITVAVLALIVFGWWGSRPEEIAPILAEEPTRQNVTPDTVIDAYYAAKITNNQTGPVRVLGVPHRIPAGLVIRVEAPGGVTVEDVVEKRKRLASALRAPGQCLDVDALDEDAESEHEIFIADQPLSKIKMPAWPLADAETFSIFRPVPVGWTPRGILICLSLMWVHTLIGAAPRRGKSAIMRLLVSAVLLDRCATPIIVDFGGGREFKPVRSLCRQFIHGRAPEQIQAFADLIEFLHAEYDRRMAILDSLPDDECPDGRISPEIAMRDDFRLIPVFVDEFQEAIVSDRGADILKRWIALMKVGPKVGIVFVAATQTADDGLPTDLRNLFLQRIALTTATYQGSMALLGNTAQRMGYDASTIGGAPGVAFSWGIDSDEQEGYKGKLKFAFVSLGAAGVIARRAAALRPAETVEAVVTDLPRQRPASPQSQCPDIILQVLDVWPAGVWKCHADVLAEWLGIEQGDLTSAMSAAGLSNVPVRMVRPESLTLPDGDPAKGKSTVARGYDRADVEAVKRRF